VEFRIADTFTDSLMRLTGAAQKGVKTTAFDLQLDPTGRGLHFHRLDRARDPNFWSVRVNADVRLIVHKTATSVLLCYVGHHDAAYGRAERRRIERHPTTGAAQLVELPARIEAATDPRVDPRIRSGEPADEERTLFAGIADETLLAYGVPPEWLDEVRRADEDTLFELADHLPQEAAEALLNLATGGTPVGPGTGARNRRPVQPSGRAAPFPRAHQYRGAGTRARFPMGEMDGLSAPGATPARRAQLYRAGANLGVGRDRQDYCRVPSRSRFGTPPP